MQRATRRGARGQRIHQAQHTRMLLLLLRARRFRKVCRACPWDMCSPALHHTFLFSKHRMLLFCTLLDILPYLPSMLLPEQTVSKDAGFSFSFKGNRLINLRLLWREVAHQSCVLQAQRYSREPRALLRPQGLAVQPRRSHQGRPDRA